MSKGVFTRMKRFKFVEKTALEVGDGTAYPLEVTPDQLAEIMYRVKDSKFTAGSFSINTFGDDITIRPSTAAPADTLLARKSDFGDTEAITARGYVAIENVVAPEQPLDEVDASWFGPVYYFSGNYGDLAARDISDVEYGMWAQVDEEFQFWSGVTFLSGHVDPTPFPSPFRTGFNQTFASDGELVFDSFYGVFAEVNGVEVLSDTGADFTGEVAWVDDDGSGNPLSSGNRLFAGFKFSAAVFSNFGALEQYISTSNELVGAGPMLSGGFNFVIELAGGDTISCPIYYDEDLATSGGIDPSYSISASDFYLTATEWWSYAKGSPPTPVWDTDTGLKI